MLAADSRLFLVWLWRSCLLSTIHYPLSSISDSIYLPSRTLAICENADAPAAVRLAQPLYGTAIHISPEMAALIIKQQYNKQQMPMGKEGKSLSASWREQSYYESSAPPDRRRGRGGDGTAARAAHADGERRKTPIRIWERTERTLSLPSVIIYRYFFYNKK
jgi:hypothetical protein